MTQRVTTQDSAGDKKRMSSSTTDTWLMTWDDFKEAHVEQDIRFQRANGLVWLDYTTDQLFVRNDRRLYDEEGTHIRSTSELCDEYSLRIWCAISPVTELRRRLATEHDPERRMVVDDWLRVRGG